MKIRWRGIRIRRHEGRLVLESVLTVYVLCMVCCFILLVKDAVMLQGWRGICPGHILAALVLGGAATAGIFLVLALQKTVLNGMVNRQRLARMLLENGWYEVRNATSKRDKRNISYFPALYYRKKKDKICVIVKISMGKYQNQLLSLESKLETGLACEMISKEMRGVYVYYIFSTDVEKKRIGIEDMRMENGCLWLMQHICWKYDALPHMLIAGVTGGGKTSFLLALIEALLKNGAVLCIMDPKNADLAALSRVMPDVLHEQAEIMDGVDRFCGDMLERNERMKNRPDYKLGENYAYYGLAPHFLIFDEYTAFMDMLTKKEAEEVMSVLKKIIMLGRQSGYFVIMACQRPDAKYLGEGIRDQFGFRAALGNMSTVGYSMMFGTSDKVYSKKDSSVTGRGYVNAGNDIVTEFYTPLVPKGYDFMASIGRLYQESQTKIQKSGEWEERTYEDRKGTAGAVESA